MWIETALWILTGVSIVVILAGVITYLVELIRLRRYLRFKKRKGGWK